MQEAVRVCLPDAERQPCEVYTRVMGYIRPTTEFNKGKQAEYAERKHYTFPCSCE
jgi:anaerobic ribonucleoside-triphosphate reductase